MPVWNNFNPEDYNENAYAPIPEGKYRVRIENAEDQISKSGKSMIKITLAVSGYNVKLWSYIVLDDSSKENIRLTNWRLGSVWNSFNIQQNNLNLQDWIGRVGGVKVKHSKDQDGNDRAEVQYFLKRSEVDKLPAWREGSSSASDHQEAYSDTTQDTADYGGYNSVQQEGSDIFPF